MARRCRLAPRTIWAPALLTLPIFVSRKREGREELAHTTSWGVSTRMVGGVIMTHGDDDGLRVPPAIAPQQVVILPMLRENDGDAALLDYCEGLRGIAAQYCAEGSRCGCCSIRGPARRRPKRWDWVRRGAPVIIEVGGRDMENGKVEPAAPRCVWGVDMASLRLQRHRAMKRRGMCL